MKLFCSLFAYGGVEPITHSCIIAELLAASQIHPDVEWRLVTHIEGSIDMARSGKLEDFLRSDCDVMVMIDHDMEWTPGDVAALGKKAVEHVAIVATIASRRSFHNGHNIHLDANVGFTLGKDELIEVPSMGAGIMAVPRRLMERVIPVLKRHPDPAYRITRCSPPPVDFYDLFRPTVVSVKGVATYCGEDSSFCLRVRAGGGKVLLWTKPIVKHHGTYGFTVQDGLPRAAAP